MEVSGNHSNPVEERSCDYILGSGYALVCTPDCHSGDQVGSNPIGPAIGFLIEFDNNNEVNCN